MDLNKMAHSEASPVNETRSYRAPQLSPLGSIQAFVLGGTGGAGDGGNPEDGVS